MHIRQGKIDIFYAKNHLSKTPIQRFELAFKLRRIGINMEKIVAIMKKNIKKN